MKLHSLASIVPLPLFEHFQLHWKCPHKRKRSLNLQNETISELPLDSTPTREGSNTLTAKRTQRNASPDHTHLFPPLNTLQLCPHSLQKILNQDSPYMTNRSHWCWKHKFDVIGLLKLMTLFVNLPLNGMIIKKTQSEHEWLLLSVKKQGYFRLLIP